jgi:membrane protease YdiL (CAAX protease family)
VYVTIAVALPIALQLLRAGRQLEAIAQAGGSRGRLRSYQRTIALQWALSIPVAIAWASADRSWSALGMVLPSSGWHLAVTVVVVIATIGIGVVQVRGIRRIAASAETRARYRTRFGCTASMLPHSAIEFRWFTALSITGGICEEFLFRGYLMWVLTAYMSLPVAIAISAALFTVGHLYQGGRRAVRAGGIGAGMNVIVWACGCLFPAMFIHALLNATTGRLAYVALQEDGQDPATSGVNAAA